ncbi:hypothetical protein KCP76_19900 [Salmonella enterica subsp. enterica serovar Weltevreden]|nr:hypothetical protein KCP76_19900 [Salmonella enterica subsp. enterica serovar Weltevreden]
MPASFIFIDNHSPVAGRGTGTCTDIAITAIRQTNRKDIIMFIGIAVRCRHRAIEQSTNVAGARNQQCGGHLSPLAKTPEKLIRIGGVAARISDRISATLSS